MKALRTFGRALLIALSLATVTLGGGLLMLAKGRPLRWAAGVQQLTYLSAYTIAAHTATSPEARAKWQAEEAIRASGVPYTIFRATWFMETLPLFVRGRTVMIIGRQPHQLHWLATADYALMVARSFCTSEALGQELYLYGPEALTMREALRRYCATLAPHITVLTLPVTLSAGLARITADAELRSLTTR